MVYGAVDPVSREVDVEVLDVEAVPEVDVEDVEPPVVGVLDVEAAVVAVVVGSVVAVTVGRAVGAAVVADCVSAVVSSGKSDGRPGPIGSLACGERTFGPIWGPDGGAAVVVGDSVTSLTSAS